MKNQNISYNKISIFYLKELQTFSLTVSNSELLDLTPKDKICVECDVKKKKIKIYR